MFLLIHRNLNFKVKNKGGQVSQWTDGRDGDWKSNVIGEPRREGSMNESDYHALIYKCS